MNAPEQDLRGETALCLMALLTWGEFHGGSPALIDGTIARFIAAPGPADPQISRAIANTRSALARHLEHGGHTPTWLPASVLALLQEPTTAKSSENRTEERTKEHHEEHQNHRRNRGQARGI